jgi:diguanylate cyclase (GGDEF)-like protein
MSEGLDGDILLDEAEFSVVMIDLNYLKVVNDKYGHDKGDAYIKKMYEMISEVFVDSPLFRIGGDEFVVIAEGREHKNCKELVETLQARMEELSKDKSLSRWESISAAIGYSAFDPNTDISVEDVFKRADNLMYENKKAMHALRKD